MSPDAIEDHNHAARAAGYPIRWRSGSCKGGKFTACDIPGQDGEWRPWRPLADDEDAFRLQNALELNTFHVSGAAYAMPPESDEESRVDYGPIGGKDKAMRFAIFKAAVSMGRDMLDE